MLTQQRTGGRAASRTATKFGSDEGSPVKRFLNHAQEFGLLGVIFVAPLMMGGRHPIGRFVFVTCVAVIAIAWVCRQVLASDGRWRWSGVEWLIMAGAMLIFVQLVPLPTAPLKALSPGLSGLLPAWAEQVESGGHMGAWSRISLAPTETASGLVMFVAYAMLFLVVVQRLDRLGDVERLLRWIAVAVTGMAALGIAQRFVGNGHFLWLYEHPFRDTDSAVKGAFSNENHFAHFLALGIAPLLWWLRSGHQRGQAATDNTPRMAVGLALALVAVAGLLTFSRGGVVVMFLAAAVCVAIYACTGLLQRSSLAALAGGGLFVGISLLIHGYAPLTDELATLGAGTVEDMDHYGIRRQLWAADLTAVSHFPLLGTGVGSHAEVYPIFFDNRFDFEYEHAENGYLQILLESGIAGFALLSIGVAVCFRWSVGALRRAPSQRLAAAATVIVAALAASLVHAIWDFVWSIPACMSLTIVLMACGCRLYQIGAAECNGENHQESAGVKVSRSGWAVAAVAVVALTTMMIQDRLAPALAAPHWDRYLRQVVALREQEQPADMAKSLPSLIDALQKTIDHDPHAARAHARIANLLVRHFEQQQLEAPNAVQLRQVREAALASGFSSRSAQDEWLSAAIGDDRRLLYEALGHVHQALRLCPLQGESYTDLAELAFLEGRGSSVTQAYLEQALRVRPFNDNVLFAVGAQSALSGDATAALRYWKVPFNRSRPQRLRIIDLLAGAPPSMFIKDFEPGIEALGDLYAYFRQLGPPEEADALGRHYAELLEQAAVSQPDEQAARQWLTTAEVYRSLSDGVGALRSLQGAVRAAPDEYQPRFKLAVQLAENQQYDEAIDALNWCQRRRPHDQVVQNCLERARLLQLRQATTSIDTNRHQSR